MGGYTDAEIQQMINRGIDPNIIRDLLGFKLTSDFKKYCDEHGIVKNSMPSSASKIEVHKEVKKEEEPLEVVQLKSNFVEKKRNYNKSMNKRILSLLKNGVTPEGIIYLLGLAHSSENLSIIMKLRRENRGVLGDVNLEVLEKSNSKSQEEGVETKVEIMSNGSYTTEFVNYVKKRFSEGASNAEILHEFDSSISDKAFRNSVYQKIMRIKKDMTSDTSKKKQEKSVTKPKKSVEYKGVDKEVTVLDLRRRLEEAKKMQSNARSVLSFLNNLVDGYEEMLRMEGEKV